MKKKSGPLLHSALLLFLASLLTACATSGRHVSDWGEITVAPGDTATCLSNPCRVFFQMPPGVGTYKVTGNEVTIGTFPAGKKVSLGSLFESNAIKLPGTDVPPTYIYVSSSSDSVGVP